MFDVLIRNGRIVDGSGLPWFAGDVGIIGDRIAAVGNLAAAHAEVTIDANHQIVAPGLIDAHVHGDLALLVDPLHEAAIRQGVTTYIIGQDGVAMTPGSADTQEYMRRYTAGFSGGHVITDRTWYDTATYLEAFTNRCALNVAVLIPNGNVRMEVMGLDPRDSTPQERQAMRAIIQENLEQGAVGISSGLDYIPSRYATTAELVEICKELAPVDGVYVSHMRGYSPETVIPAMEEMATIFRESGCAVHISHFNCLADVVLPWLDHARQNVDITFDLYCYLFGSTILGMIALPPDVQQGGVEPTLERLSDPAVRASLRAWFENPRVPLEPIRLSAVAHPRFVRYEGWTLADAAKDAKMELGEFICEVAVATRLAAGTVVPHDRRRTENDLRQLMNHPAMMGGSDGIFVGGCPHPRGTGCFARYLGYHVRDRKHWSLEQAVSHLSYHAARRHGLRQRGLIRAGMAADVIVFDPESIADRSTFEQGKTLAVGMSDVLVNGKLVLHQGMRTPALPGRGLRRGD
ncbi:N-acyl-D-amino-acid deacylase family protein [Tuwongella immobilis]|uniref:Amidohydrolase 3 domain-containing protein n=1 Tax=Tuwongella immobilis TaxID=692036 RepID=A0A6C2YNZ8_9BACT|nr:D-aminoacylase [Tuwongella immobilis]VIP03348.1 n-acyl-d-aspartate d-glutamate deacylase : N-acyl-D-aspartate/D-glutamate deacylase OS=Singulisphaera acidiphila (strain ATCC BAA-1392 / DSM 18658 / VKM B-2454 / MOB10) GN=Sinac_3600 PE=4 SV=1: Amidohydro_3: D-aminoacyl_C [Tuwongella immobilis]VTS04068.1 n-acyl-d-aspartate d-glutamate deacylase : N-acyl-D-aspartate/D-glutamate deacylase OS=Singulisphaera acidiphila (strain ATCC BAA-1392 / DSM 18658 / VKM B-2454 / MOB10) GN=Sinac_3600 PE=4 SV=1: A